MSVSSGVGGGGGGGGGPPTPVDGGSPTPAPPENAFFARAAELTSRAGWPEAHGGAMLCADARYSCVQPAPRTKVKTAY